MQGDPRIFRIVGILSECDSGGVPHLMNTPHPTVSIVIPVFNRSASLIRAVRSCFLPDHSVEVIVVDDGSTEEIQTSPPVRHGIWDWPGPAAHSLSFWIPMTSS